MMFLVIGIFIKIFKFLKYVISFLVFFIIPISNRLKLIDNNRAFISQYYKKIFKEFWKSFCGKNDAFDCAGIRAQVFRWIPAQSKASFFPQKDFQNSLNIEFICIICDIRVWNCLQGHLSTTYPIWYATSDPPIM